MLPSFEPCRKFIIHGWVCSANDLDSIAGNIIGYKQNSEEKFIADIVNGPMDADKLDYLVRDAYFAGPTVVYDLERFLQTVDAITYPRDPEIKGMTNKITRLSIKMEGVTALEQIIISKLMLFSYVYHHHKIRCVEAMCHEALRDLMELSRQKLNGKVFPRFDHPSAFLGASDRMLLPLHWPLKIRNRGTRTSAKILTLLTKRELYKRALIISRLFVDGIDENETVKRGFEELLKCGEDTVARDVLRGEIYKCAKQIMNEKIYKINTEPLRKVFEQHHVLVDIPKAPTIEETVGVMVPVAHDMSGEDVFVPLIDVFPIEKWVDAYNAIKWRGYIYSLEEAAPYVNRAAQIVLAKSPYELQFTPPATTLCKLTTLAPDESALMSAI